MNIRGIELTPDEIEQVYRYQEHRYLLMDAEHHLAEYFCIEDSYNEDMQPGEFQEFEDVMGFSFGEAINASSEHYLLEDLVNDYELNRDCNDDENSTWESIIERYAG